jgi:hypothetical protein
MKFQKLDMNSIFIRVLPLLIYSFAACLIFSSCGGNENKNEQTSDTTLVADTNITAEAFFQIPLPGDLFLQLKNYGVKAKAGILNPVENINKYTDQKLKAINFGVYSSDLFYCSTFDQKADVLKYFNNMKKLADELGISSVITDETLKRIEKNLGNKDSLNKITNDVFFEASSNLESNGQGATLALVVAGGLTESIYLSTQASGGFKAESAAIQYIADQKHPLENLFQYLEKNSADERVAQAKKTLQPLKDAFDSIKEVSSVRSSVNGKKVIGGSVSLGITAEDFTKITSLALSIRNEFTLNNSAK